MSGWSGLEKAGEVAGVGVGLVGAAWRVGWALAGAFGSCWWRCVGVMIAETLRLPAIFAGRRKETVILGG